MGKLAADLEQTPVWDGATHEPRARGATDEVPQGVRTARRLKRLFKIDVGTCEGCGGQVRGPVRQRTQCAGPEETED